MAVGRLSIGAGLSSGTLTVLVNPASVTVGSGSATVSGNGQISFSGASSVSINNCFTSLYKNYRIVWNATCTSAISTYVRMRKAGVDTSTGYYGGAYYVKYDNTSGILNNANNAAQMFIAPTGLSGGFSSFDIYSPSDPAAAGPIVGAISGTGFYADAAYHVTFGCNFATNSYDGITFFPGGGTVSGTIRIYGYANGA